MKAGNAALHRPSAGPRRRRGPEQKRAAEQKNKPGGVDAWLAQAKKKQISASREGGYRPRLYCAGARTPQKFLQPRPLNVRPSALRSRPAANLVSTKVNCCRCPRSWPRILTFIDSPILSCCHGVKFFEKLQHQLIPDEREEWRPRRRRPSSQPILLSMRAATSSPP